MFTELSQTNLLVISLSAIIFLLALSCVILLFYFFKTNKKFNLLLEKEKIKDLKDVLLNQIQKTKDQEAELKSAIERIKSLEDISQMTIQKIGIVRFNPFSDMGGNQSFAIALLNKKNNGFVISSLFIKEGSRVYAKQVKDGKSDYILSKEEQEAIERAMNSK